MSLPSISLPSLSAKRPRLKSSRRSRGDKATTVVGLEIEPSHIAAAEVSVNGKVSVRRGAVAMLEPGAIREGELGDSSALVEALRAFFAEHDLPRTVRLGIANQRVVVRTIDLPVIGDPAQLAAAVRVQAPDHIPMPMGEAVLDFQSLGVVDTSAGPRTRVVVVAVRRDMIERLTGVCEQAGLKLAGIDLSAFAMLRALDVDLGDASEAVLYVSVGGLTNVAVASGADCVFTRTASGGVETMAQALAERCALTPEHARQWLRHVGLALPAQEVAGEPEIVEAAREILIEGVHHLSDSVRNSIDFYCMQDTSLDLNRAVLTGPALDIPGFADSLSHALNLPFTTAAVAEGGEWASRLTIAAGLAVEQRPGT